MEELYRRKEFSFQKAQSTDWKHNIMEFLSIMYADELDPEYIGYSFIQTMSKHEKHRTPHTVTCRPSDKICDAVDWIDFKKTDYYITANRFKSTKTRNSKNLFGYSAFIADIDIHQKMDNNIRVDHINNFVSVLLDEFFPSSDLPVPNAIVFTGCGIQLWWKLAPCAFKGHEKAYQNFAGSIIDALKYFIDINPVFSEFSIDSASSKNGAGLVRMPGTYNTKARTYGDFFMIHNDSVDLWNDTICRDKKAKPAFSTRDFYASALAREDKLKKLLKIRQENHEEETRDLFLFAIFNAFLTAKDEDAAWQHTLSFNMLFSSPMPEHELKSYLSTSKRIKGYRLSNAKIIEKLSITSEEAKKINLHAHTASSAPVQKPNEEAIISCCKNTCQSLTEISNATGASISSVKRILKKNRMRTKKQKLHNRILTAFKQGKPVNKKDMASMSKSGISYIKKQAEIWREHMKSMMKKPQENHEHFASHEDDSVCHETLIINSVSAYPIT